MQYLLINQLSSVMIAESSSKISRLLGIKQMISMKHLQVLHEKGYCAVVNCQQAEMELLFIPSEFHKLAHAEHKV
jgi:hypothetical protein